MLQGLIKATFLDQHDRLAKRWKYVKAVRLEFDDGRVRDLTPAEYQSLTAEQRKIICELPSVPYEGQPA